MEHYISNLDERVTGNISNTKTVLRVGYWTHTKKDRKAMGEM